MIQNNAKPQIDTMGGFRLFQVGGLGVGMGGLFFNV